MDILFVVVHCIYEVTLYTLYVQRYIINTLYICTTTMSVIICWQQRYSSQRDNEGERGQNSEKKKIDYVVCVHMTTYALGSKCANFQQNLIELEL